MFAKIYDKVVNYIKEDYKFLIAFILILFLGLFHLPINLHMGGGLLDIKNRLEVENSYQETGSFNMTYVRASQATIPTYLLSYVFGWERENINDIKLDENDNVADMWKRDLLYLQEANDNAILSAYTKAGLNINIKKEILEVLYIDKDSETDLKVGDIILEIGGIKVTSFDEIKNILKDYNVGDEIKVLIHRDNKDIQGYVKVRMLNDEKKIGIYLVRLYDYELPKKVKLNFNDKEGGPSGGFMISLAIYNRLIEEDLTKGRKISGTGTIDKDGNIGEIGGVKYKVMGASAGKADIFFVPEANYQEAMDFKKEKGYDLNIVMVKTLDEAIDYLRRN